MGNVDIKQVLEPNKISLGGKCYKYFISYSYNGNKAKPLHMMLLQTSAYVKNYDGQTKWLYSLIKDDGLLEKYNSIWDNVSTNIKKELDSDSVYNKEFLKTKISW